MKQFTPGPWKQSSAKTSALVASEPHEGTFNDMENVEWYGGHLLAESIKEVNMPLLLAAPEMFAMLEKLVQKIENFTVENNRLNKVRLGLSMVEARILLAKIQAG